MWFTGFITLVTPLVLQDPKRPEPENDWIGVVFFAFGLVFFVRAIVLSVYLTPTHVIVRSWFTTRKHPIAANLVFTVAPYEGWFNDFMTSSLITTLVVSNAHGRRPVKGLLAFRGSALRQVRIINDHVTAHLPVTRDLPPSAGYPREGGKHEAPTLADERPPRPRRLYRNP
jgi:hypothetical protein